ncbi:carbon storage regulator CsrA [Kiloniella sp.]|uniref:carbon storage regulator CsrA n=1 Tax=Kiloniella sp. TaxID=1938587 RepID=UPI003B02CD41
MLYLTRKIGESVIINNNIEVKVVDIRGKSVKIGFTFPEDATVLRQELHERIQEENKAAAAHTLDALDALDLDLSSTTETDK